MYEATGRKLVRSFIEEMPINQINVYSEDELTTPFIPLDKIILNHFREKHKSIIPKSLGGEHNGRCGCRDIRPSGKINHIKGCPCSLWNRNMYRWFHKVVAIYQACDLTTDYLVWLDSDCYLKKELPDNVIEKLTKKNDIVYMKGSKRVAIESGILIFNMMQDAGDLIQTWFNHYILDWFKKEERWDDGYILTQIIKDYWAKDMCEGVAVDAPATVCPLAEYIGHNKGTHVRDHKMF